MKIAYGFVLCFVLVAGWVAMEEAKHFIEPDYTFGSGYFILNITVLVFMLVSFALGLGHSLLCARYARTTAN